MIRYKTLQHRFVRNAPRELEPAVLYISLEYATAVHSCCCGCGERVVTPLTPTDWKMTFDGESVTITPSVGNWNQGCRSHYIIERNRVIECDQWTDARIDAESHRDKRAKASYYGRSLTSVRPGITSSKSSQNTAPTTGLWSSFLAWLSK